MTVKLTLDEVDDLTFRALRASNTGEANARSVTASVVASEADGIHSHGLARLPTYREHARCGKINGQARATADQVALAAIQADAADGFAHPAIDLGLAKVLPLAEQTGIAALSIVNSYNCGVCGYHVERMAQAGLVALGFVNAPASIAPWGGKSSVFGTNPISCAFPRPGAAPVVIDQSSSVIARSEVSVHAANNEPIPEGWALDAEGQPTTDPKAVLAGGSMVPSGGYKGAGIALIVEVLAAALTGANLSIEASSFADNSGGPPRTGQFFIVIDPQHFAGEVFSSRIETLLGAILSQEGTRLPGDRRIEAREIAEREGVTIRAALRDKIESYCTA